MQVYATFHQIMAPNWKATLREHSDQLPDLSELHHEHHHRLHDWVTHAIQRESQALERAMESSFNLVPRLLRGPVKKLFGA